MNTLSMRGGLLPRTYHNHYVGYENIANAILNSEKSSATSFPPFNIERITNKDETIEFVITMAVAGFLREDLNVTINQKELSIVGKSSNQNNDEKDFIHHGIGNRDFSKTWSLADNIEVTSVTLANGILSVSLKHELPESEKPKQIEIK